MIGSCPDREKEKARGRGGLIDWEGRENIPFAVEMGNTGSMSCTS